MSKEMRGNKRLRSKNHTGRLFMDASFGIEAIHCLNHTGGE
jgi:hypothetical protein